jgi:predicted O-methyltransferase YrrM
LDLGRQLEFVERELGEFCREFDPPMSAADAGPHRFYLRNGTYETVDAELLYAMARRFKPQRILELGSGYSTLILREALERQDAVDALRTYDPYPSHLLMAHWPVTRLPVQDIPDDVFRSLGPGDLLFVDTSHTVKTGGDVNRIVLDFLPILQPGVIVHFHDIFLPYPYSRAHLEGGHFWNEQYLLQAFLSGNEAWEILVAASAIARAHDRRLADLVPSFRPGANPGAFWIRRRG